ncbi:Glycine--tRNA ligase alpha subunit [Clarias magur]|uniref:Glycine--tRNA ligase alpha subunit n=1 Tax=Clarias magur TaxID=1594786 RepID=A0A8J4U5V9_CLAMG|nr:Glycine--tRNA ligase alpha subunit [Clarias magur]
MGVKSPNASVRSTARDCRRAHVAQSQRSWLKESSSSRTDHSSLEKHREREKQQALTDDQCHCAQEDDTSCIRHFRPFLLPFIIILGGAEAHPAYFLPLTLPQVTIG